MFTANLKFEVANVDLTESLTEILTLAQQQYTPFCDSHVNFTYLIVFI